VQGACRSSVCDGAGCRPCYPGVAHGCHLGAFTDVPGVSKAECQRECARDAGCLAYEYFNGGGAEAIVSRCELHTSAVDYTVDAAPHGFECYLKPAEVMGNIGQG